MDFYLRNGQPVGARAINGFPLRTVCDYRRDWLSDHEVQLMENIYWLCKKAKLDYVRNSEILEFVKNLYPKTDLTANRISKILSRLFKHGGLIEAKYRDATGSIEGYRLSKYGMAIVMAEIEGIYSNPKNAYTKKWTGYQDDDKPKCDAPGEPC